MMSKTLINRSLSAVYKEILLDDQSEENEALKTEIQRLASDSKLFIEKEIEANKKQLQEIDYIADHQDFVCHTDGAVLVTYDSPEEKSGKNIKASAAFTIASDGETLFENYFPIPTVYAGKDTNSHMAEYQGFISCLRVLSLHHPDPSVVTVDMFTDSTVLVKQMNLEYRVRDAVQRSMREEALYYVKKFKDVNIAYIPRAQNKRADTLAHKAMEEKEWVSQTQLETNLRENRKRV